MGARSRSCWRRFCSWYGNLVARRPGLVLICTYTIAAGVTGVALMRPEYPNFDQADKGFSPRNTDLAGRIEYHRGLDNRVCNGDISARHNKRTYIGYDPNDRDDSYSTKCSDPTTVPPPPAVPSPPFPPPAAPAGRRLQPADGSAGGDELGPAHEAYEQRLLAGLRAAREVGLEHGLQYNGFEVGSGALVLRLPRTSHPRRAAARLLGGSGSGSSRRALLGQVDLVEREDEPPALDIADAAGIEPVVAAGPQESHGRRASHTNDRFDGAPVCSTSSHWRGRIVFTAAEESTDLFTAAALRGVCELDALVRAHPGFQDVCGHRDGGECCASRSLGLYVARLSGRTHCANITDEVRESARRDLTPARVATPLYSCGRTSGWCVGEVYL